jgi:hypothetical protein
MQIEYPEIHAYLERRYGASAGIQEVRQLESPLRRKDFSNRPEQDSDIQP